MPDQGSHGHRQAQTEQTHGAFPDLTATRSLVTAFHMRHSAPDARLLERRRLLRLGDPRSILRVPGRVGRLGRARRVAALARALPAGRGAERASR